jgi:hypothetical protein
VLALAATLPLAVEPGPTDHARIFPSDGDCIACVVGESLEHTAGMPLHGQPRKLALAGTTNLCGRTARSICVRSGVVPTATRRAAIAVLLVAGAAAAVIAAVGPLDDADPTAADTQHWATTVNRTRGFALSLPAGWRPSGATLTPKLTDPRELLSAGTFPLRFRESTCNHLPAGALEAMDPRDGFISVYERGRDRASSWTEFAHRPEAFADRARPERGDVAGCLERRPRPVEYWIPFTDAGRHFYALAVLGADAAPELRTEAFEILDRLRFDPAVKPGWRASP